MADWRTTEPLALRELIERVAETFPLSLEGLMQRAGMSSQSLRYWRNGDRTPQPESMERVGRILVWHGERLRTLGMELLKIVEEEELRRRQESAQVGSGEEPSLFDVHPD